MVCCSRFTCTPAGLSSIGVKSLMIVAAFSSALLMAGMESLFSMRVSSRAIDLLMSRVRLS